MQIVIDIDDDLYKSIINHRCKSVFQQRCDYEDLKNAIEDGTPLPKDHGRLIDADKLKPRDISPEAWYSPMWGFELVDIEDAPTIIEADTESEE